MKAVSMRIALAMGLVSLCGSLHANESICNQGFECAADGRNPFAYATSDYSGPDPNHSNCHQGPPPTLPAEPNYSFRHRGTNTGFGSFGGAKGYMDAHQVCLKTPCDYKSDVTSTDRTFRADGALAGGTAHITFKWWLPDNNGNCTVRMPDDFYSISFDSGLHCPAGYDFDTNSNGNFFCFRRRVLSDVCCGDPIRLGTSNKEQVETDFRGAGPFPLQIVRHYSAQGSTPSLGDQSDTVAPYPDYPDTVAPFGPSWRTEYQRSVSVLTTVITTIVTLRREDGSSRPFVLSGDGTLTGQPYEKGTLERLTNGGQLTGWRYHTPDEDTEVYDANGKLQSITNAAGFTQALTYDVYGKLYTVAGPFGRTLQFHFNSDGRIDQITAPDGGVYAYTYTTGKDTYTAPDGTTRVSYDYPIGALATVTYPDGSKRDYEYDEAEALPWALKKISDEVNGNPVEISTTTYDSATGAATSTQLSAGSGLYVGNYTVSNTTMPDGTISTSVTEPLGANKTYSFSLHPTSGTPFGYLLDERVQPNLTHGGGDPTSDQLQYDSNGNLIQRTDDEGRVTTWTYNSRNLETQRVEGFGSSASRTITTDWSVTRRLPTRIAEPLRLTTYTYNDPADTCADSASTSTALVCSKRIQGTTDADGSLGFQAPSDTKPAMTWAYHYNEAGQLTSINGPRTDITDLTTFTYYTGDLPGYFHHGDLQKITVDAMGWGWQTQFLKYDDVGRPTDTVDWNGLETLLTYWPRGWLKSREIKKAADAQNVAVDETSLYDYDVVGDLTKITRPDGSWIQFDYDQAHRLTDIQDSLHNVVLYTLDSGGNRQEEDTYPPGGNLPIKEVHRQFDALGRLWKLIATNSATTALNYDQTANPVLITPPTSLPNRQPIQNGFDALSRLLSTTNSAGATVTFGYDGLDQLTTVTDPRSLITTYSTDGRGNLGSISSPDTGTTTFFYDAAGNTMETVDARPRVANYLYDDFNRAAAITYGSGDAATTFSYDQGYNGIGRLTGVTDWLAGTPIGNTAFSYDGAGRLKSDTRTIDGLTAQILYGYDQYGRLSRITYPSGRQVTYTFDGLGRVSTINVVGNGVTTPIASGVTYQPFGALSGYTLGSAGPTYVRGYDLDGRTNTYNLGSTTYLIAYDDANNITKICDENVSTGVCNSQDPAAGLNYTYYPDDRLETFMTLPATLNQTFHYDPTGNRTQQTVNGVNIDYTINLSSNRLDNVGGVARTYDDSGNQLTGPTFASTTYDDRGRMTEADTSYGPVTFGVNGLGQRVKKTSGGVSTYFDYDKDGHLIGEYDATGVALREVVWLGDTPVAVLSSQTVLAGATDDFDGDATPDVLFRDTNGDLYGDFMNPDYSPKVEPFPLFASVSTNFDLVGIADLDRDGHPDVIWRDTTTGDVSAWLSTNPNPVFLFNMDLDYKIVGFGDFNGDGKQDMVVISRSSGYVAALYLDGTQYLSSDWIAYVPPGFVASAIADFNADGKPDIIVQDQSDGSGWAWYFDGARYLGADYLGTPDVMMNITRVGDFNRDGRADIVLRDPVTKVAIVVYFAGATQLGYAEFYSINPPYEEEPLTEDMQKLAVAGHGAPRSSALPPGYVVPRFVRRATAVRPLAFARPTARAPLVVTTSLVGRQPSAPPKPPRGKRLAATKDVQLQPFAVYDIYTDHLDTPRLITRRSDGKAVWRWDNTDPFRRQPAPERSERVRGLHVQLAISGPVLMTLRPGRTTTTSAITTPRSADTSSQTRLAFAVASTRMATSMGGRWR